MVAYQQITKAGVTLTPKILKTPTRVNEKTIKILFTWGKFAKIGSRVTPATPTS
jgi:hypothetical protein